MDDIPDQKDDSEVIETELITSKNKSRPTWVKVLFLCGNKAFYAFLNIFAYFTNRGIFALKVIATFNLVLIGFVFAEWWFYQYIFTELIPEFFKSFQTKYYSINKLERE